MVEVPPASSHLARDITLVVLGFCVALMLVGSSGDFPLNDDWAFAASVREMLDHGTFRPSQWAAMTLLTQVLWGSAFTAVAGYSFDVLRFSTAVMALIGAIATYLLLRASDQPRWLCQLTTWTVAFTPLYFVLSVTFMTDVPFTALLLLSALFFVRHLHTDARTTLLLAIMFSLAAVMTRQLAVALPIAYAITYVLRHGLGWRRIGVALVPVALAVVGFLVYRWWLAGSGRLPAVSDGQAMWFLRSLMMPATLTIFARNFYVAFVYLGLFLLPVTLAIAAIRSRLERARLVRVMFGASALVVLLAVITRTRDGAQLMLMPLADNLLVPSGLGPVVLRDQYLLRLDNIAPLPQAFWIVVTVVAMFGAALLLALIVISVIDLIKCLRHKRLDARSATSLLLLLTVAAYLFPLLVTAFFDRYLVPAVPLLAAGLAAALVPSQAVEPGRATKAVSVVLIVAMAAFSIAGTHDYLAWNRLRWQMLDDLMQSHHLTAADIDGGFEFNGMLGYDPNYVASEGKSSWWIQRDTWQIGFGGVPGYSIVEQRSYPTWLPNGPGHLVVLKKNDVATSP